MTMSFPEGCGYGSLSLTAATVVFDYFSTRRPLAVSLSIVGNGLSFVVMAPLSRWLLETCGWRGTFLLISGCTMQCIPLAMFFRPVRNGNSSSSVSVCGGCENSSSSSQTAVAKGSSYLQKVSHAVGVSIICRTDVVLFIVSTGMALVALSAYVMHISNKAVSEGIERYQAALLPSIYGLCNSVARPISGLVANQPCVNIVLQYGLGLLSASVAAVIAAFGVSFSHMAFATGLFGFTIGIFYN